MLFTGVRKTCDRFAMKPEYANTDETEVTKRLADNFPCKVIWY